MAFASFAAGATTILIPIPESAPLGILVLLLKPITNVIGLSTAFVAITTLGPSTSPQWQSIGV